MALILNIETATAVCSVALAENGKCLSLKEENAGYTHAEKITLFIEQVLKDAGKKISDVDAVAVSFGPGSYTGLRIGVSTAKGLCYALEKPLIAIETLRSLAVRFVDLMSDPDKANNKFQGPGYHLSDWNNYRRNYPRALGLRENATEAENLLWENLKGKGTGYKFRRQHVIDQFIVDFVCISKKLIVEVDGKIHESQKEYDEGRTTMLEQLGFTVIRFTNEEVIANVIQVVSKIKSFLSVQPDLSPDPFPKERGAKKVLPIGKDSGWVLIPMIDARRMEVYCAAYDDKLNEVERVSARIIDENSFDDMFKEKEIYFFGDGAAKCKPLLSKNENAIFIDNVFPSAASMIPLSEEKFQHNEFENVALFEPFYLKEFSAKK